MTSKLLIDREPIRSIYSSIHLYTVMSVMANNIQITVDCITLIFYFIPMYNSIYLLLLIEIYNNKKSGNEVGFNSLSLVEYNFSFSFFFFPNEMSKQKLTASGFVFTYHVQNHALLKDFRGIYI